jgi:hypothetical protein
VSGRVKLSPLGRAMLAIEAMASVLPPHLVGLKRELNEVLGLLQETALGIDTSDKPAKKTITKKRKKKGTK